MLDTKIIRRSFSRASVSYDSNALLQRRIGLELLENIKSSNIKPSRILDIGAGTGWLSQELEKYFNVSVFGIDSAKGMVYLANAKEGLSALQAEAEHLPFKDKSFDCLVSNLALQWVADLETTFSEAARVLESGGKFYFSCFGPHTLEELRLSLNTNLAKNEPYADFDLADEEKIRLSLQNNGFKHIDIRTKKLTENFDDFLSLLRWLKLIGANTVNKPRFIGRHSLSKANEFYVNNFRVGLQVYATFHLIQVSASK